MRKYYRLTDIGQEKIEQFLDEWEEIQNVYRFVREHNESAPDAAKEEAEEL